MAGEGSVSHFIVDETKCRRDGICVAVCPIGILTRGEDAPPAPQWRPLQIAFGLPAGHRFCGALIVGEPRYRYHRLPPRREPPITWR